jgi:hypothetical protein
MGNPYYDHAGITIYHGDCREILPRLQTSTIITDPTWPNARAEIFGKDNPIARERERYESSGRYLEPS